MNEKILKIIKEEIAKMYEDTGVLNSYPELKEAVLKFNRLLDEGFDSIKKINSKIPKYNISNIDSMQKDKDTVDEIIQDISEIKDTLTGYAYESTQISDDEQIDVADMLEHVSKYFYSSIKYVFL